MNDQKPCRPASRIIEGAQEALSVAKGEQPAASITVNGHKYVPASRISQQDAELERMRRELADMTISRDGYAKQAMAREAEGRRKAFIEAAEIADERAKYWRERVPVDTMAMTKEEMREIFKEKSMALENIALSLRKKSKEERS